MTRTSHWYFVIPEYQACGAVAASGMSDRELVHTIETERLMSHPRAAEIRRLNALSTGELMRRAGGRLTVVESLEALHLHFADSIAGTVEAHHAVGRPTALILPYGPVGQYRCCATACMGAAFQ